MRTQLPFAVFVSVLLCALFTAPAQAQRARVFVASYGNDSNPCTFLSPCKTFQQAVNVVAAGGEVTAIDSAGFGPINITQSVTITSPAGVEAGIVTGGDVAINIDAPGATIVLRGLTLEGNYTASDGINATAAGAIEIYDCTLHNFTFDGISIQSPAAMSVVISNTVVSDVQGSAGEGTGIFLNTNGGNIIATLDRVTVDNNTTGIYVSGGSGTIEALISNSHIDNSLNYGLIVFGNGGGSTANLALRNTTINQTPAGVSLDGYASVYFSQVTVALIPAIFSYPSYGVSFSGPNNFAYSDGTNHLGAINGGSPGTWGLQ